MVTVSRNPVDAPESAPKPSIDVVVNADGSETITDSKGRKLTLRDPDMLLESRFVRAMGESASNMAWMTSYAFPAATIVQIDDMPMIFPMTEREVDAAIQTIGREGFLAYFGHMEQKALAAQKKKRDEGSDLKK